MQVFLLRKGFSMRLYFQKQLCIFYPFTKHNNKLKERLTTMASSSMSSESKAHTFFAMGFSQNRCTSKSEANSALKVFCFSLLYLHHELSGCIFTPFLSSLPTCQGESFQATPHLLFFLQTHSSYIAAQMWVVVVRGALMEKAWVYKTIKAGKHSKWIDELDSG